MFLNRELIKYNDKLFWVYRKVRAERVKDSLISELKEYWLCDMVLKNKKDDEVFLFFVREIQDAEILEPEP